MKAAIKVPGEMACQLDEFIAAENINLRIATTDPPALAVEVSSERREGDCETLWSGGWISCVSARQLSGKLDISLAQTGKLLDHLDVKVRQCELGCF